MANLHSNTTSRLHIFFLILASCLLVNTLLAQTPQIRYFTPLKATTGSTVTIHGSGFASTSLVSFGGINATSFTVSQDTMIMAVVGNGATGDVVVTSSGGIATQAGFTFSSAADAPNIASFSPTTGPVGTVVTIKGHNFTGATRVTFGGTAAASFVIVADTVVQATVGYGSSGLVDVSTPSGASGMGIFTYIAPAGEEYVNSFTPFSGKQGDTIHIHGSSLTGTTQVRFGGVAAQGFVVVTDTLIDAVVGNGASGQIWASGVNGVDSVSGFEFLDTSTVHTVMHSFSPASAGSGSIVQIHGVGFNTVNIVRFGGTNAASFTILADTLINAQVGNGASGQVLVAGTHGRDSLPGFTYISQPAATAFQLVSFTASANGGHAQLQWQTFHDQGIAGYEVDHAPDSTHFSPVGVVASQHKDTAYYIFTDSVARTGMNFYRLKMVDTAGHADSSFLIAVAMPLASPTLTGFPNPALGSMFVPVPESANTSKITVSDMNGRVMMTVIVPPNTTSVRLDLTRLLKGVYKMIWTDGARSAYQTVLVWK